ncbi:MAG: YicC family protein [Methylocystis sp.]|nr:YicC family protein [Methylocystis sp.]MCA3583559.1 YicC family protein [Methylocystis sp.]MCA3589533.1 YicC family protein [Methylocystis sp.]MCA3592177.1 YicC family protein [Methylocystis sp.]
MSLRSMTGFARAQGQAEGASWAWEMKSVNAKGFDLRLRLPTGLDVVEAEARRMIGTVIGRGTVHVSLDLTRGEAAANVRINEHLLETLAERLTKAAARAGLQPPSFDAILAIRGVVETVAANEDPDSAERLSLAVIATLEEAVLALCAARQQEGDALETILKDRIAAIARLVEQADALPSRGAETIRARLRRQVDDLLGAATAEQLDGARLYQEAVMLAVKADIREELDRLKSHVAQVQDLLERGGAIGRRLDFLAQELSRETNTLCAKSGDVALTAIGLDLKSLVEQFREQVQNVE